MTTQTRPSDLMTIRQMCDAYEVTPRTLRFYEAKELLTPVRDGTRRLFTRRDRARLTLILRGKRFGFSLEDIRQTLDLYDRERSGPNLMSRLRTCRPNWPMPLRKARSRNTRPDT
jgi:DNA-binding transcriptional MerR regulator